MSETQKNRLNWFIDKATFGIMCTFCIMILTNVKEQTADITTIKVNQATQMEKIGNLDGKVSRLERKVDNLSDE